MSAKAYRVEAIKCSGQSFDLSSDEDLVNFLNWEERLLGQLNESGSGLVEISVETLKKALTEVNLRPETKKAVENDIDWAKRKNQDWIRYYFF